ncbi:unnamed protein product [Symbiodinium microadriaticum]|nr:unnamed protein product [Symbiodinium microadriaticum]
MQPCSQRRPQLPSPVPVYGSVAPQTLVAPSSFGATCGLHSSLPTALPASPAPSSPALPRERSAAHSLPAVASVTPRAHPANHTGSEVNAATREVRALQQSMPPLSEQVLLGVPPAAVRDEDYSDDVGESAAGSTSTATAIDDFLVSKAVIPQEPPATHIGLMPLRNHRSSAPAPTSQVAMPTVLLVVVQADGDICLYTVSGDLALAFRSGHKQAIVQMAVSPMQDEYVVATVDSAGVMRVHRLFVRPRRGPQEQRRRVTNPDEEKVSSHLGSPANITVQFNLATRVPLTDGNLNQSSQPHLTAFIMTSAQGVKYFVAGDSVGWISAAGPTVQENFFMLRCHHLDTDKPIVLRFSPGMERCTADLALFDAIYIWLCILLVQHVDQAIGWVFEEPLGIKPHVVRDAKL